MRTRPTITVQPFAIRNNGWCTSSGAMIRMRGKWVLEIFRPGTRLTVTRELRNNKTVLVLEETQP